MNVHKILLYFLFSLSIFFLIEYILFFEKIMLIKI